MTLRTRHLDKGLQCPLPGDLWIDTRGRASSLNEATTIFGNMASAIVNIVSFAANAAIGDVEPNLAYDNTRGLSEREFLQSMLPDEGSTIRRARSANIDASKELIGCIEGHGEIDRIMRAIAQYCLCLQHWRWGHEILATAHLYIGMEGLTKAVLRSRLQEAGATEEEFAAQLGIDSKAFHPGQRLSSVLETQIRREILFRGDKECYRDAKSASDGFEHGYMPFDEIRDHAVSVRNRTASYFREAVLDLLRIGKGASATLLSPPYEKPLGNWPMIKYIRGCLIGDSENLASPSNEYPIMIGKFAIKSVSVEPSGEYRITCSEDFTPRLGNGIAFQAKSFEVWGP